LALQNITPGWATYLRVSDEDKQTPERSFAMQRKRIQEQLLSSSEAPLYREYTDLLSGTNPNRKDYQQMLTDAETGKFCVIIFDEFHHLQVLGIKQIYKQFSKMLMIQKKVLYIILSSAKFKAKKVLSSHLALLFGNFQIMQLEPFDLKTTENFIINKLKYCHIRVVTCTET